MKKLLEVKSKFGKINKDGVNPYYNSKYATLGHILNTIEPVLNKEGLHIVNVVKDNAIVTAITDSEGASLIESSFNLPQLNDPQKMGSAITYGRRYNLVCIFNLNIDEDDDGNSAKPETKKPEVKKPEKISKVCQSYVGYIEGAKDKKQLADVGTAIHEEPDLTPADKNYLREIYKEKESKLK